MTKPRIELHYNLQEFILNNGSIADKLRLLSAGYEIESRHQEETLDLLGNTLNPDGGVPFNMAPGNPSSVKETAEILPLIYKYKDSHQELIQRMVGFLVARQKNDGGFAETLNLNDMIEDKWGTTTGREWYPVGKSITWLTGKALDALCLVGYDDEVRLKRARDFLMYSQHEDGHWPDFKGQNISDPLSTGNILPALKAIGVNSNNKVYKDGRAALLQRLKASVENELTCDMVDLHSVGPPGTEKERELIKNGVGLIVSSQNPDGGWRIIGAKKSDPELSSILAFVVSNCTVNT
ncbi:MAG: prenyltransferase/squalene oxidase repeat-containing protein [Candidatus Thorarchaeota archaeon]